MPKYVNPFAEAWESAKPMSQTIVRPEVVLFDPGKFDLLCQKIQTLIETDPVYAGLEVDLDKVRNAGKATTGSIMLGYWGRAATPDRPAASIAAYRRKGKLVCTNVPAVHL